MTLPQLVDQLYDGLQNGQRRSLAKAITLIEANLPTQREQADQLLEKITSETGKSIRIGISGAPGVGKSTFIEAFGKLALEKQHKIAILAVDPSSPLTGGSIMGDKVRMEELSRSKHVFIRPSPSQGSLGGVSRRTREVILLCEAAGYDLILVETVGVGQSEVHVASMVDCFVMLQLPNAGDELQGIKKGILEIANIVVVTKSDGTNKTAAKQTQLEHDRALKLVRQDSPWQPPVLACSALQGEGIDAVYQSMQDFINFAKQTSRFEANRTNQNLRWFDAELIDALTEQLATRAKFSEHIANSRKLVLEKKLPPGTAARKLITTLFEKLQI